MPNRETCGNFMALKETVGKPFNGIKSEAWVNAGQACIRICGKVRRECVNAADSRRKREQEVPDVEAV